MKIFFAMVMVAVSLTACGLKKAKAGIERSQIRLLVEGNSTRAEHLLAAADEK